MEKTQNIEPKGHGLLIETIKPEDYVLGGYSKLKGKVIRPDGQWLDFLPDVEKQSSPSIETNSCTSFGTTNAIEILSKAVFNKPLNLSDRMVSKGSGTDPDKGNYPKAPAEYLRKKWSVFEEEYPFVDNLEEYFQELPKRLVSLATGRGAEYDMGYEYVPTHDSTSLLTALMYSPVCISCNLMLGEDNLYYKPRGWSDAHWATLVGYKYNEYWIVFDSYSPHLKYVKWDTKFDIAMRYSLERQIVNESFWQKFLNWLNKI